MKKVIVTSLNPVKIEAVKNGFQKIIPELDIECTGMSVPSNVSDQPISDKETLLGAENRVNNAFKLSSNADYFVGIEGGIEIFENEMQAFAWIVIKSEDKVSKSRTSTFILPKKVTELIKKGNELGVANDIIFKNSNSKQKNGAVGILTNNAIDRTAYYTEAVVLALIPFKNPELY